jgi:hypothetical protein
MSLFTLRGRVALAGSIVTALVGACAVPVVAQDKTSPPNFAPDPMVGWIGVGGMRPVPGTVSPLAQDPKYPFVPNGTGQQPTYRIADFSNQNLKPWVVERMKKDNAEVLAGKIAFTPHSSCAAAGVPAFHLYGFQPMYFIQTPKVVVMIFSGDKQVRHVYLDVPHSANPKPSWYGESVGYYEGDTLVVDTIGLNDKSFVDNFRTPHTEKLHVVERFKLVDGGKALEVDIRLEDPDAFYEPWLWKQRYDRVQQSMREEICAEGNRHLFD